MKIIAKLMMVISVLCKKRLVIQTLNGKKRKKEVLDWILHCEIVELVVI